MLFAHINTFQFNYLFSLFYVGISCIKIIDLILHLRERTSDRSFFFMSNSFLHWKQVLAHKCSLTFICTFISRGRLNWISVVYNLQNFYLLKIFIFIHLIKWQSYFIHRGKLSQFFNINFLDSILKNLWLVFIC